MTAFTIPEASQVFAAGNVAASTDREGAQQTSVDGVMLWEVRVVTLPAPEPGRDRVPLPEVLRVQVPSSVAPTVQFGQRVVFAGLTVRTWAARDGRQGLMYAAEAVVPAGAARLGATSDPGAGPAASDPRSAK